MTASFPFAPVGQAIAMNLGLVEANASLQLQKPGVRTLLLAQGHPEMVPGDLQWFVIISRDPRIPGTRPDLQEIRFSVWTYRVRFQEDPNIHVSFT